MTIDERLERLRESLQALSESIESLTDDIRAMRESMAIMDARERRGRSLILKGIKAYLEGLNGDNNGHS